METRLSDSTMHKNIGIEVQKNDSRSSGLMVVAEARLFIEGLENSRNVFYSRIVTPNIQPRSFRTIFSL